MEEKLYIKEEKYQKIKKILNKKDDYFNSNEFQNLMQFLMKHQRKNIKKYNSVKHIKVTYYKKK